MGYIDDNYDGESLLSSGNGPVSLVGSQVSKPPSAINHQAFVQEEDEFIGKVSSLLQPSNFAVKPGSIYLEGTEFNSAHCDQWITATDYVDVNDTSGKERSIEQPGHGLVSSVLTTTAFNSILEIGLKSRSIAVIRHSIFVMSRIIATSNTAKTITKSVPSSLSLSSSPEQAVDLSVYQVVVSGYRKNFSTSSL